MNKDKYLTVNNSAVYHRLRTALGSTEAWTKEKSWLSADVSTNSSSLKGAARIGPEPGSESRLSDHALEQWRLRMADFLKSIGEVNADLLDYIVHRFLATCHSPDQSFILHADEFLEARGLKGRGRVFRIDQREDVAARMAVLSNSWLDIFEVEVYIKGKKKKLQRVRSRAVVVSSVAEEIDGSGSHVFAWRVRPGDFLADLILGSGKQFAFLDKKVIAYDPRLVFPKRISRYFLWILRIRNRGEHLQGVRVGTILDAIQMAIPNHGQAGFRKRFESGLDRLASDEIFLGWRYQDPKGLEMEKRGWAENWIKAVVIVEPPEELIDQYASIRKKPAPIPAPDAKSQIEDNFHCRLKAQRLKLGLTQIQCADRLGVTPNWYALLERGVKQPSEALRGTIDLWLGSDQG